MSFIEPLLPRITFAVGKHPAGHSSVALPPLSVSVGSTEYFGAVVSVVAIEFKYTETTLP